MFSLAHLLIMSGSGDGRFTWQGPTTFYRSDSVSFNFAVPELALEIFPDGRLLFKSRRDIYAPGPPEDPTDVYTTKEPGQWLHQLNAGFGAEMLVRVRSEVNNIYQVPWTGRDIWQSLNVAREYKLANSAQPPATLNGTIAIDFAFASSPEAIVFTAVQNYYLYRPL